MADFGDSSDEGSHKEGGTRGEPQNRGSREAVVLVPPGNQLAAHKPTRLVA